MPKATSDNNPDSSRRRFLAMTAAASAVAAGSLAVAAATPVSDTALSELVAKFVAPAMAAEDSRAIASVKRVEEIVELLRTRYIREGWKMDEEAAERALAYCRKYAEDGSDPDDEREVALDFFHSHGQSLDWVFDGDIGGLICSLAKNSTRAKAIADSELFALADRYAAAYKKWGDSISLVDKMDKKARPMPERLQWRDEDVALGLPDIRNSKLASRELAWDCEAFVGPLRNVKWTSCIKTGDDDDLTLHLRQLAPPPEARARADEIIAAFDRWMTERAPRGYKKAQREGDKAFKAFARIQKQVEATPAQTVEGMMAKVRCAKLWAYNKKKMESFEGGAETIALSIFDDLQRLTVVA